MNPGYIFLTVILLPEMSSGKFFSLYYIANLLLVSFLISFVCLSDISFLRIFLLLSDIEDLCDCSLISILVAIVLLRYSPCNELAHHLLHYLCLSSFILQVIGNINHPPPPINASWHTFLCYLKGQILYVYLRVSLKETF